MSSNWLPRPTFAIDRGHSERLVIVSPHCDDAAFALGGLLSALGPHASATVVTCFSRSDYAWESHSPCAESVTETRMAEDREMIQRLALMTRAHVDVTHLGLDDAPLRLGLRGVGLFMRAMPKSQLEVARAIAAALADFAAENAVLIAPFAIGGHVDHHVARRAAEDCARDPDRTLFYEDQPYAAHAPRQARQASRGYRLACRAPFPPAAKAELLRCYPSQIGESEIDTILRYDVLAFLRRRPRGMSTLLGNAAQESMAAEHLWRAAPPRRQRHSGWR